MWRIDLGAVIDRVLWYSTDGRWIVTHKRGSFDAPTNEDLKIQGIEMCRDTR